VAQANRSLTYHWHCSSRASPHQKPPGKSCNELISISTATGNKYLHTQTGPCSSPREMLASSSQKSLCWLYTPHSRTNLFGKPPAGKIFHGFPDSILDDSFHLWVYDLKNSTLIPNATPYCRQKNPYIWYEKKVWFLKVHFCIARIF